MFFTKRGKRGSSIRLKLTTADLAKLFDVSEQVIRHMLNKPKDRPRRVALTGDPVEDFITLARLARDKGLLD